MKEYDGVGPLDLDVLVDGGGLQYQNLDLKQALIDTRLLWHIIFFAEIFENEVFDLETDIEMKQITMKYIWDKTNLEKNGVHVLQRSKTLGVSLKPYYIHYFTLNTA